MLMKKSFMMVALFGVLASVMALVPGVASAEVVAPTAIGGAGAVGALTGLIQSNYGVLIGLGVAAFGLWMWLMDQSSWGIVMMIGGVAITAFPGLWQAVYVGVGGVLKQAGASEQRSKAGSIGSASATTLSSGN